MGGFGGFVGKGSVGFVIVWLTVGVLIVGIDGVGGIGLRCGFREEGGDFGFGDLREVCFVVDCDGFFFDDFLEDTFVEMFVELLSSGEGKVAGATFSGGGEGFRW